MITSTEQLANPRCCGSSAEPDGGPIDHERIERAVREILIAIGDDPDRDGLRDTPSRVARSYSEIFGGLHRSPSTHLQRTFDVHAEEVITLSGINVFSVCEHHLLPFVGKAHVAYLPQDGQVVGLSKLARTVEVFARRPQIQERLTGQVADAIMTHAQARGALVVVEAEHFCMKMRGVRTADSAMTTIARRGAFRDDPRLCDQVLSLITNRRAASTTSFS